jgi:protein-S-isoprenylcysteine O-methyltransferase Ste14
MNASRWFAVLDWAWLISELLLQVVTPTTRKRGQLKDRGSLLVLLPTIFASVWGAMWFGETHPRTMLDGADWLGVAAVVLMAAGLAIRWTAIYTLGVSFSTNVAIHATQTLRTRGLYRLVRHPSYTGMLLCFAAIGVYERNWVSLAIMLVFPTAALLYRMHVEEIALRGAFGEQYVNYSRTTRRLIPGIY